MDAASTQTFFQLDTDFFSHLAIHLTFLVILVRGLYYPSQRNQDLAFSYLMFGVTIFIITAVLIGLELSLGFAFGLFAVFGILRYRTEAISTKELTFLFIVIAMALLNAVAPLRIIDAVAINSLFVGAVYAAQNQRFLKNEYTKVLTYEKIELVKPARYFELLADIEERTGISVERVEVGETNFLRDTAQVVIFYRDPYQAARVGEKRGVQTLTRDVLQKVGSGRTTR